MTIACRAPLTKSSPAFSAWRRAPSATWSPTLATSSLRCVRPHRCRRPDVAWLSIHAASPFNPDDGRLRRKTTSGNSGNCGNRKNPSNCGAADAASACGAN